MLKMNNLPDELIEIVKNFVFYKPTTKQELKHSIIEWCAYRDQVMERYGHISLWDTSLITDMSGLFQHCYTFNDDISQWNVSAVTSMSQMFQYARMFNQPLDNWDVSSVTDMSEMFDCCKKFNQPLNSWNVGLVTNMKKMFVVFL